MALEPAHRGAGVPECACGRDVGRGEGDWGTGNALCGGRAGEGKLQGSRGWEVTGEQGRGRCRSLNAPLTGRAELERRGLEDIQWGI